MNPEKVRKKLIKVLGEQGITVTFITKKLGWDYAHMIKFKNGYMNYSAQRLKDLSRFLDRYDSI